MSFPSACVLVYSPRKALRAFDISSLSPIDTKNNSNGKEQLCKLKHRGKAMKRE